MNNILINILTCKDNQKHKYKVDNFISFLKWKKQGLVSPKLPTDISNTCLYIATLNNIVTHSNINSMGCYTELMLMSC